MSTTPPEDNGDHTIRVPRPDGPPAHPPPGQPPAYGQPAPPPQQGPYGQPAPNPYGPPYGGDPPAHQQPGGQPYAPPPHGGAPYGAQYGGAPYGGPQPGAFPPQGYGAAPYAPVDKRQIRPRLLWIGLAWLVAVLTVIGGVVAFAGGVLSSVEAVAPSETFAPGEERTITLDPADQPALYVASPRQIAYQCAISDGTLARAVGSATVTINGVVWEHILNVNVPRAGEYQIRCDIGGDTTDVRFGVGKGLGAAAAGIGGSVLVLILVPAAGVLLAIIVTIVVLARRSSARKRLSASYGR